MFYRIGDSILTAVIVLMALSPFVIMNSFNDADKVTYEFNYLDEYNTMEERYNVLSDKYLLLQESKTPVCEYKAPTFNYYGMLIAMILGMFGTYYVRDILGWKFVKEAEKKKSKK